MTEKNFGYLGTSFQQGLLKTIIEDKKFAITIIDSIDSKYFDGPYFKYLMENIKELYKLYGVVPGYDTLQQKIMKESRDATVAKVNLDTLEDIKNRQSEDNKYIKDTSLNFCKQQVLKKALKVSEEIMNNGEFENYGKIEEVIREALQVGATTDDVQDISKNVRESLQKDCRVPFPTGVVGIDNLLKGGLARGELAIFLAPTGIGKTTWLTKVANSAFNVGANVLHLIFEDNISEVRKKHYTIWTGIPPDQQFENQEEVIKIVEEITERPNFLKLLKLPGFGVSVADIKSKIRKLEAEGNKVDVLVIDYVDCISLERSIEGEEWKGEGTIMRSLEAMTDEFNMAIWTATQGNRDSIGSDVVTTDQMGGSIKKAQVGHVVISAAKTLEQKEHNLANVTLLKSRIGKDGVVFTNCKFDNEYLQIDTETQTTLLGHEEERQEAKKQRAADVYRDSMERKEKIRNDIEEKSTRLKLESAVSQVFDEKEREKENLNMLNNFEKEEVIVAPPMVAVIEDVNLNKINDDEVSRRQRAAEVYKKNRNHPINKK